MKLTAVQLKIGELVYYNEYNSQSPILKVMEKDECQDIIRFKVVAGDGQTLIKEGEGFVEFTLNGWAEFEIYPITGQRAPKILEPCSPIH